MPSKPLKALFWKDFNNNNAKPSQMKTQTLVLLTIALFILTSCQEVPTNQNALQTQESNTLQQNESTQEKETPPTEEWKPYIYQHLANTTEQTYVITKANYELYKDKIQTGAYIDLVVIRAGEEDKTLNFLKGKGYQTLIFMPEESELAKTYKNAGFQVFIFMGKKSNENASITTI